MSEKYVLLLRGINVNPSTRVAMADLRGILAELGLPGATTLLQSGNVIVDSVGTRDVAVIESAIESAVLARTGVTSPVIALPVAEFRDLVEANPLRDAGDDESRLVIVFLREPIDPTSVSRPTDEALAPERLVITPRAIYQWCPDGILQSRLKPAWWKQLAPVWTARNIRTARRILAQADKPHLS